MTSLLGSAQFWFGALLLCAFQFAKFNEIKPLDTGAKGWAAVPNLHARDFVGLLPYRVTLVVFVLVTLAGYVVLCLASPQLIGGWLRIVGQESQADAIDKITQSSAYPLWIAAAFMGLAHQTIPGLARISNVQRDVFHDLVGIPSTLVETASRFSTQILAQSPDKRALGDRLALMCSDRWRADIEEIADIDFFETQLKRLKLDGDDDIKDKRSGSVRELRGSIEQVVCVACIATVRKDGAEALAELADHLGVERPREQPGLWHDLMTPALGCFTALVVLLFVLPEAKPLAAALLGAESVGYWPDYDGDYSASAGYLLGQVVPVLLAAGILASWVRAKAKANAPAGIGALLVIVLFVVGYDYVQDLWGYGEGDSDPAWSHGPARFIARMAPFHALHALIVLAICAFIQSRVSHAAPGNVSRQVLDGFEVVLVAAVVSSFYGWVLMKHYYSSPVTFDYMLLVILLNVAAAVIVFVAYRSIWRRRQARRQGVEAPEPLRFPAAAD